jgi:hypothetical protein
MFANEECDFHVWQLQHFLISWIVAKSNYPLPAHNRNACRIKGRVYISPLANYVRFSRRTQSTYTITIAHKRLKVNDLARNAKKKTILINQGLCMQYVVDRGQYRRSAYRRVRANVSG